MQSTINESKRHVKREIMSATREKNKTIEEIKSKSSSSTRVDVKVS